MIFERHLLFPSQVVSFQLDNFYLAQPEIISYVYSLKEKDPNGQKYTNRGGWHSQFYHSGDYFPHNEYVYNAIQKCIELYGFNSNTQIELANMWFILNHPGSFNVPHKHPLSSLSGVLYCKTPKNSGNILFHNEKSFSEADILHNLLPEMQKETKMTSSFSIVPEDGMVLLFPAHMSHEVSENLSNEDRIVLAFNLHIT